MRFRLEIAVAILSVVAVSSASLADDIPGLLEAPPGFNNLPFSLPTGDARWCYMLRDELKPILKEEASFFFEGRKEYLAELLANTNARMFHLPHSDLAVVARHGCKKTCKVDIAIRSTFNVEIYEDVSLGKSPRVEAITSGDDWKTRFGFSVWINDLRRKGVESAFVYYMSRSADRSKVKDGVEYGFQSADETVCQDL
ncbi:hypothetical protein [Pleomorphomonas carboxyditropha]|uniref:Uncharacterized protein n=1 Tax=Pleomorphomonas carboxyditropha TaxID=2023338 RepID=A0A2G9X269_9HYPH|nr:hypothetical protein [Pleomorphomonas carboxyditropha]PIP00643.1 hypothetical protein CJ014_00630 [Pleomorphomonas carboxyditropha]